MLTNNSGRVALVTGASRGIGAAIAVRLAAGGMRVLINHRASPEAADEVAQRIVASGGQAEVLQTDVSDLDAVRTLMTRIRRSYGRLDVLINNAGRSEDGLLLLMPHERW